MSQQISQASLAKVANVTDAPARTQVNRTFELPAALFVGTLIGYFGFLAIMITCFMNPELAVPLAVIGFSILAGFGLGYKWVAMHPDNGASTLSWGQFANRGVQTLSGRLTALEASAQVLILPVLIVFWGLCIAVIVAML
ncbi:MAG: hypothetical protein ACKOPO_08350 [Novosphingobium sp.]